jgi:hypothetical protein
LDVAAAPQVSWQPHPGCVLYAETLLKSPMMNVSTLRKLGIIARVASRQAGKSRIVGAVWRGLRVTAASFWRVLGILWLEVTGFVFLCLSGIGGLALAREYTKYQAGQVGSGRVILAVCFTLTFAWFGVSSFWRARRKG